MKTKLKIIIMIAIWLASLQVNQSSASWSWFEYLLTQALKTWNISPADIAKANELKMPETCARHGISSDRCEDYYWGRNGQGKTVRAGSTTYWHQINGFWISQLPWYSYQIPCENFVTAYLNVNSCWTYIVWQYGERSNCIETWPTDNECKYSCKQEKKAFSVVKNQETTWVSCDDGVFSDGWTTHEKRFFTCNATCSWTNMTQLPDLTREITLTDKWCEKKVCWDWIIDTPNSSWVNEQCEINSDWTWPIDCNHTTCKKNTNDDPIISVTKEDSNPNDLDEKLWNDTQTVKNWSWAVFKITVKNTWAVPLKSFTITDQLSPNCAWELIFSSNNHPTTWQDFKIINNWSSSWNMLWAWWVFEYTCNSSWVTQWFTNLIQVKWISYNDKEVIVSDTTKVILSDYNGPVCWTMDWFNLPKESISWPSDRDFCRVWTANPANLPFFQWDSGYIQWKCELWTYDPIVCSATKWDLPPLWINKVDANPNEIIKDWKWAIWDDIQIIEVWGKAIFKITVKNYGTWAMENIKITDQLSPNCAWNVDLRWSVKWTNYPNSWLSFETSTWSNNDGILSIWESFTYTCESWETKSWFINEAIVTWRYVDGGDLSDDDTSAVTVDIPVLLDIEKTDANSSEIYEKDANWNNIWKVGDDTQRIMSWSQAIFKIRVKNNTDWPINNIRIEDEISPDCAWNFSQLKTKSWFTMSWAGNHTDELLDSGEWFEYTCKSQANIQKWFINEAIVYGNEVNYNNFELTDIDTTWVVIHREASILDINKVDDKTTWDYDWIVWNDWQKIDMWDKARFKITIKNNSTWTVTNIKVDDIKAPSCNLPAFSLNAWESKTYNCDGPVMDNYGYINTATVTWSWQTWAILEDWDESAVIARILPPLDIDKVDANSKELDWIIWNDLQKLTIWSWAIFKIKVKNNWTWTIKNIIISDPMAPNCAWSFSSRPSSWENFSSTATVNWELKSLESFEFTCRKENIFSWFVNRITVTWDRIFDNRKFKDIDESAVLVISDSSKQLVIEKLDANPNDLDSGQVDTQTINPWTKAVFKIRVTNKWFETIRNIVVTDALVPNCDSNWKAWAKSILNPGESFEYTCELNNVSSSFTNTAVVTWIWDVTWKAKSSSDASRIIVNSDWVCWTADGHTFSLSQWVTGWWDRTFCTRWTIVGAEPVFPTTPISPFTWKCAYAGIEYSCKANITLDYTIPSGWWFACWDELDAYANNRDTNTVSFTINAIWPDGLWILDGKQISWLWTPFAFKDITWNYADTIGLTWTSALSFSGILNQRLNSDWTEVTVEVAKVKSVAPMASCGNVVEFKLPWLGAWSIIIPEVNYYFKKPYIWNLALNTATSWQVNTKWKLEYKVSSEKVQLSQDRLISPADVKIYIENRMISPLWANIQLQETMVLSNMRDPVTFETRINSSVDATTKNYNPWLQVKLPIISYTLGWKTVRYNLTDTENPVGTWSLSMYFQEVRWIRVVWWLQGDGKQEFIWTDSNISDLSNADQRTQIRKNAYSYVSSMSSWSTVNGVKYVKWDITISWDQDYETLVVVDWNVIISWNLNPSNKKLWIIVLKDGYDVNRDYQTSWNVYVNNNVTKLNAIIYADWGFISSNNWVPYRVDSTQRASDLQKQLTMRWSLFTKNTIGWAENVWWTYVLPGGIKYRWEIDKAMIYDLTYLRTGNQGCDLSSPLNSICTDTWEYEEAFVIIYDNRVQTNPPKLFSK